MDYGAQPQYWLLFDRLVQQLVLQSENQEDHDQAPITINVRDIVEQYVKKGDNSGKK